MMPSQTLPSVEISIAMLSWMNDQLRDTAVPQQPVYRLPLLDWLHNAVAFLAAGMIGLCVIVLQQMT